MTAPPDARRPFRIALFVLLAASAGGAFLLGGRLWALVHEGGLPVWAPLVAPIAFTAFVILLAIDRLLLVRRHGYPFVRALVQVGLAVAFLSFLWPSQAAEWRAARAHDRELGPGHQLLRSSDPLVRAAACELLAYRGQKAATARIEQLAQHDRNPAVRDACSRALLVLGPTP